MLSLEEDYELEGILSRRPKQIDPSYEDDGKAFLAQDAVQTVVSWTGPEPRLGKHGWNLASSGLGFATLQGN